MREINSDLIENAIEILAEKACCELCDDAYLALEKLKGTQPNVNAEFALDYLIKNAKTAKEERIAVCQDTGLAVVFLEIGQDVHITGKNLNESINDGIKKSYKNNGFRMSVLDPISRVNTNTNTPAVIHTEIVKGEKIKLSFIPKGFGSENMTKLFMLTPAEGLDTACQKIVNAVKEAGSKPCPPIVVGIGFGGTAETAILLSKKALFRKIGSKNSDPVLNKLEEDLLKKINELNIGPQGFKGTTAHAVFIEKFPTHIAAFPVGVSIQCNCVRKSETIL